PYYRCPVQTELDELVPNPNRLHKLSNFEDHSVDLEKRLGGIVRLVGKYGLPWLDLYSSIPALQTLTRCDYGALLHKGRVLRAAYDYLRGLPAQGEGAGPDRTIEQERQPEKFLRALSKVADVDPADQDRP